MAEKVKKLSKQEVREDRVATAAVHLYERVQSQSRWLVAGGIVILVAILGVFFLSKTRARSEENASLTMFQAQALYFTGDYAQALTQFEAVGGRFGSSRSARLAPLFEGNCELALGKPAEAEAAYRRFLPKAKGDPALEAAAWRGIAASLAAQTKLEEAAATYERSAQIGDNPLAAEDWFAAGRAYSEAGNHAQAARAFRQVVENYPESARVVEARVRREEALARS